DWNAGRQCFLSATQSVHRLFKVRSHGQSLLIRRDSVLIALGLEQQVAEIQKSIRHARIQPRGLTVRLNRKINHSFLEISNAEIVVAFRATRIELQGLTQCSNRLVLLS